MNVTRRLTLRARLTLLTAVLVALAVAGCAGASYILAKDQLYNQLDLTLSTPGPPPGGGGPGEGDQGPANLKPGFVDRMIQQCGKTSTDDGTGSDTRTTQAVLADGTACAWPGSATIVVTQSDIDVAKGLRDNVYRDGVTTTGVAMRVYTRQVEQGRAVSIAEQLQGTEESLRNLALLLIAVSAVGIVAAGTAGLIIARAALRPVDQLTDTVEHIARTEDLTTRIPVSGKDEIARLSESFNTMTAALSSSRERQQQLIADAGHELRTPLTSLRTNIDLLLRSEATGRPLPAETRTKLLASVKAQMRELSELVGDLLELGRPAQQPAQVELVALHELVEHAVERARLRGPGLRITLTDEPWYVRAEPGTLERAVVNLLDNAVKFSPPGGEVEVRLAGGELSVRDHGPGIPAADLPHVFERFWRSPSARSLPGSGLGLSIVARTVSESGGQIRLERAEGGGTRATIRLPGKGEL